MAPKHRNSSAASSALRYAWVAYWLGFAAFTLNAARYPGFVANPRAAPYPWVAALFTCALLGVQTAALNAILRQAGSTRSWRRVAVASGLALLFAMLSLSTMSTDMAGYYYAPPLFAVANVIVVPIVGATLVLYPGLRSVESSRR